MQEKSQLKKGIVLNYINLILGNLIPIFYTPIMLSLLGQNEYGLYKLSNSVTSYLSLISLGIGSAVLRFIIKARTEDGKEAEERVLGLFVIIFRVIALVTIVVGIVLTLNLDVWYTNSLSANELSRMQILVFLLVCNTAISFLTTPYLSVVNAHEKFVFLQCMNIMTTCVGPILNLVMLFLGFASIGMVVSSLAITILCRFLYCFYIKRKMEMKPRFKNLPTHLIKEILGFSFWIFVANVVGQLYNATDTVMIGAFPALATTGVAVYNIGATFNSIVFSLTIGVSSLLAPKVNKMIFENATGQQLTDLAIRVGRLQCFIISLLVTGFIAFGQPFLDFYVGSGYEESYWIAIFMMIPNMIPLVQSVCLSTIVAQNKHRFRSIVYLGIAIANIIGTWFLLQKMGVVGAALMTGLALLVGQGLIMNIYYSKRTVIEISRFWKEISRIYIWPIVMCVITILISNVVDFYRLPFLFAGIVIYTVVYAIFNYVFVMNNYERNLIKTPLKRFINRIRK